MPQRTWTDPRDGTTWLASWGTPPAMASGGHVPDATGPARQFRFVNRADPTEVYVTPKQDGEGWDEMSHAERQAVLDYVSAGRSGVKKPT